MSDVSDERGGFWEHMPVGAKRRRTTRKGNGPDARKAGSVMDAVHETTPQEYGAQEPEGGSSAILKRYNCR